MKNLSTGTGLALLAACMSLSATVHAGFTAGAAVQWLSATGGNDHWYLCVRFATVTEWTVAQSLAESWGGHLATITSAEENQFVYNVSLAQGGWDPTHPSGPYLGARKNSANQFEWVTGEAFTYTNWLPGEPSSGSWEPYLNFLGGGPGTTSPGALWNDTDDSQMTAMFEFNSVPVPAPSAIALLGAAGLVGSRRRC
jgi:hypothetical protein